MLGSMRDRQSARADDTVEMGRGSSLKIICGLQVCICFDSLPFLLMHLLGSNNQLKGEWHFAFDSVET
jgi:hypothetical protein